MKTAILAGFLGMATLLANAAPLELPVHADVVRRDRRDFVHAAPYALTGTATASATSSGYSYPTGTGVPLRPSGMPYPSGTAAASATSGPGGDKRISPEIQRLH